MGQFMGVLALLLSETPVLPLNVTRYIPALKIAISNLRPINSTILGIQKNYFVKHELKGCIEV